MYIHIFGVLGFIIIKDTFIIKDLRIAFSEFAGILNAQITVFSQKIRRNFQFKLVSHV